MQRISTMILFLLLSCVPCFGEEREEGERASNCQSYKEIEVQAVNESLDIERKIKIESKEPELKAEQKALTEFEDGLNNARAGSITEEMKNSDRSKGVKSFLDCR